MIRPGTHSVPLLTAMRGLSRQGVVPWIMALLLLAQALFTLQSHTRLEVNDQGLVVQVCTLGGIVEMQVDSIPGSPAPVDIDNESNPAMSFSQLMAEAMLALAAAQPAWLSLRASDQPPAIVGTPVRRPLRLSAIRAPPFLA